MSATKLRANEYHVNSVKFTITPCERKLLGAMRYHVEFTVDGQSWHTKYTRWGIRRAENHVDYVLEMIQSFYLYLYADQVSRVVFHDIEINTPRRTR